MPADNGPHKYKIANKLDPRVDSSSQQGINNLCLKTEYGKYMY
jgi:hypothetical protein